MTKIDVLAVMDDVNNNILRPNGGSYSETLDEARAAVAELIEWQRQAVPLMKAAASWMPSRKCAMHIREIDGLLARIGGAA